MVNAIALFVVVNTVKGIDITRGGMDGFITLAAAALVIGLVNTFIKPVILVLTLPLTVLTLGLFTLFVNALMFGLAGYLVKGFEVTSIIGAIIGALAFSVLSFIFGLFIPDNAGGSAHIRYKVIDRD
jgi:putative membrane protein